MDFNRRCGESEKRIRERKFFYGGMFKIMIIKVVEGDYRN